MSGSTQTASIDAPRVRPMSEWLAYGAVAIPVAILTHELGHGIVGTALGLKGGRISYASAGFSENTRFWAVLQVQGREAASAVASPLDMGLMIAAGPIVSLLTALLCVFLVRRGFRHPLVPAVGLFAAARVLFRVDLIWLWLTGIRPPLTNQDESRLALLTGIPEGVLVLGGLGVLLLIAPPLTRAMLHEERPHPLWSVALGYIFGFVFYLEFLGPIALP